MVAEFVTLAQESEGPNFWLVWGLFIVAGLLVGGVWSAYQSGNKVATIVIAVIAAVTLVGAFMWLFGEMGV